MKFTNCDKCGNTGLPLNETIKIDGETYCKDCIDMNFTSRDQLKGRVVEKLQDPTVCATCGKDFGDILLPQIVKYPTCDDCALTLRNKILPFWVKLFFAAVLAIVLFSFFWNMRFFTAYRDLNKATSAFSSGDFVKANELAKTASGKVPEADDLRTFSVFVKGVSLLAADKPEEALEVFNSCKEKVPADFGIDAFIAQAKMGIGFNTKDYHLFLSASKENLALDSTNVNVLESVASAYSCLYATTGQDSDKVFAQNYLQRAFSIDSTGTERKMWANMINYRMETRDIITKEDFKKKYPNGWIKK